MKCRFCWRQGEDQPCVTGVDGREPKHIAKEDAVRFCRYLRLRLGCGR
jgi:hypothetical protein